MKLSYPTMMILALAMLAWVTPMSAFTRGLAMVALAVCAVVEARRWRRAREEARWVADTPEAGRS